MSDLQFPKNPVVGQQYDFPPYKYYWDGTKWKTMGIGYNPVNDLRNEVEPRIGIIENNIKDLTTQSFEALRRSYAEAGLNLVDGSFEEGGTLTSATDVLLYKVSDIAYSYLGGFPHTVTAGTDPSKVGSVYTSCSNVLLRDKVEVVSKAVPMHEVKDGAHAISGVMGLRAELDAIKAASGDAVLDVKWLTNRSPMRNGYTAGDGQTLSRVLYPDAFSAIQAGLVPVCSDADWLANPTKRGCFTLGDGSTTFRVPDYNGKSEGSLGAMFQRGDGLNSAGVNGAIQGDAIRNITGTFAFGSASGISTNAAPYTTGALVQGGRSLTNTSSSTSAPSRDVLFDASNVVPTSQENRPVNVTGCWAVKLFGAVQNAGSADAAVLATAVADLASRMSVAEQRKSTCLVNATGTGAPHETVSASLPANLANNSRYVLTNPFGANVPVICWAEIFYNGRWSDPGFIYSSQDSCGYGVAANYVQGAGIIIQTGSISLIAASNQAGGGHGVGVVSVPSAPCRVFIQKLEV